MLTIMKNDELDDEKKGGGRMVTTKRRKFKIIVSLFNVHEKTTVNLDESVVGVGASCLNQKRHHEGDTIGLY